MKTALRTLWICLLLLALPVQGFSAAQMSQCGPGHERMQHASTGGHDHGQHAQAQDHQHADAAMHADDAPVDGSTPPAKHHCSACAACCVGMALPSSAPVVIAPAEAVLHRVATGAADPIFLTSGLERPPRSRLA